MRINLFRDIQWLLSNATNNINQLVKITNTTGVIYKKDIDYMRGKIEKLTVYQSCVKLSKTPILEEWINIDK